MASPNRVWGYSVVAVACLGSAFWLGMGTPDAPKEAVQTSKAMSSSPRRWPSSTPSAPAPVYVPPEPTETVKALQPGIDARPEVQAQKRAIEAKAASGVDAVMRSWKEQPLDQEVVVETVMALHKIGTPEAAVALESMKKQSPTACGVLALMNKGGN